MLFAFWSRVDDLFHFNRHLPPGKGLRIDPVFFGRANIFFRQKIQSSFPKGDNYEQFFVSSYEAF